MTLTSYKVVWNIARYKKPYSEGDFVKHCLKDVIETLAPDNRKLKGTIADRQLSRHTVETRIPDINETI